MSDRLTDRARMVMVLANQEAQRLNHEYIGVDHILVGLVKEGGGVGAMVLKRLDVDLRKVRIELEKLVKTGSDMVVMDKLPQTPQAKQVIEYAIEEAGDGEVGTYHILLGLMRAEGAAAEALQGLGVTLAAVRGEWETLHGVVDTSEPSRTPEPEAIELFIDPGKATAEEISELYVELSTLYRMLGGSGISFTIAGVKEPQVA